MTRSYLDHRDSPRLLANDIDPARAIGDRFAQALCASPVIGGGMAGLGKSRLVDAVWLLFWMVASSVGCVSAAARLSATFDEPTYINCGLESWHTGSSKLLLDLGTMPLPPHVQTL